MLVDPSIGKRIGFGGVILHGLSTYGFAARHLVSTIGGGDPTSLRYFSARFTSPVKPGDELETRAWDLGALTVTGMDLLHSGSLLNIVITPSLTLTGAKELSASASLLGGAGADVAEAGKGEWREVGFETWNLTSGKCVIGGGLAWIRKARDAGEKAKL